MFYGYSPASKPVKFVTLSFMNLKLIYFITIFFLFINPACFAGIDNPFLLPTYSTEYDPGRDPFTDGENALKFAQQTQRNVMIEVGGDWCQWCHILDQFINDHTKVKNSLHDKYVLLKVNVSDANKNETFMASMPAVDGYPHIFITSATGFIIFSGDLSPLLNKGKLSEKLFLEFLERWQIKK